MLTTLRYTLQYGVMVSKPIAARWAQAVLDARWTPLIRAALAESREMAGRAAPRSRADPQPRGGDRRLSGIPTPLVAEVCALASCFGCIPLDQRSVPVENPLTRWLSALCRGEPVERAVLRNRRYVVNRAFVLPMRRRSVSPGEHDTRGYEPMAHPRVAACPIGPSDRTTTGRASGARARCGESRRARENTNTTSAVGRSSGERNIRGVREYQRNDAA